jgi:hypothetical protein
MDNCDILQLASMVQDCYNSLNKTNLLNVVHMNENAHSRILGLFLQYVKDNKCPFLESFLRIKRIAEVLPKGFNPGRPFFVNEQDRIDLLIEGKNYSYAIIIENKVYDACDQESQIERYLTSCKRRGVPEDRLFALYLTRDGSKIVTKESLTDKAREILGISDGSNGRFAAISFKYDLLPWLRGIKNSCEDNTTRIKAALAQYTDYVEEMCGEGENNKEIRLAMDKLFEEYGITSLASITEHIQATGKLQAALISQREERCRQAAKVFISPKLRDYCELNKIELNEYEYSFSRINIRMSLPGLSKSRFGVDVEKGSLYYGIAIKKGENEILPEKLIGIFKPAGFNNSKAWPAYKYPDKDDLRFRYPATNVFWEVDIEGFADFVIKSYEEIKTILGY